MSASVPSGFGAVHWRSADSAARPAAPNNSTATRTIPTATGSARSTALCVRSAARSAMSIMNAIGSARASAGGASPARELWKSESHHIPAASATTDSARSSQLLRDEVSASVARPKITALRPTARRGPKRPATRIARKDVAKTAAAATPRLVFGAPKKVSWNVELNVRRSAKRKRSPMTPKVTSPITRGSLGPARLVQVDYGLRTSRLGTPEVGELARRIVHVAADHFDRGEGRVVGHGAEDQRSDRRAVNDDRQGDRAAAVRETLEGERGLPIQRGLRDLVDRRSGHDARLPHRTRDRVVAIVHRDREFSGGDAERVVELSRDIRVTDELASQHASARVRAHQEGCLERRAGAASEQIREDGLCSAVLRRGALRRRGRWKNGSRGLACRRGWRLEATRSAHLSEARRRHFGDRRDEPELVVGEPVGPEGLHRDHAEDLAGADQWDLQHRDVPMTDVRAVADREIPLKDMPPAVVAGGVAARTIVNGLTTEFG